MTPAATREHARLFRTSDEVVLRTAEPARKARHAPIPAIVDETVRDQLARAGIEKLYDFQANAVAALLEGRNIMLAGGTGSGKSLCYQIPIAHELEVDRRVCALYISPTKALAQDQFRRLDELVAQHVMFGVYDADTERPVRADLRRTGRMLLTNPDMLSASLLPTHAQWARFWSRLRYVVIDEAHVYRGVFGSHVANVLRRLRRICAHYGTHPVFAATSGTIANPAEHFTALTGLDVVTIGDEGAPSAGRDILLWNPEVDEEGVRTSSLSDATRVFTELIEDEVATIVFARTRKTCELIHKFARDRLRSKDRHDLAKRIAPYRAGYTPEQRRKTERALAKGDLLGVVATSALELGIDIGSLEASVCVTFPGSVTSLRQQWGRAGRGSERAVSMLIGGPDALDQYFMARPDALLERPVERAVIDPRNPRILNAHLAAATCELPLREDESDLFGEGLARSVRVLVEEGRVREGELGAVYCGLDDPASALSLRSTTQRDVLIVEEDTGTLLGSVNMERAPSNVYPGAVYLHQGESYHVTSLDLDAAVALVDRKTLPYYTLPKIDTNTVVREVRETRRVADIELYFGMIEVHNQLVGYQRKALKDHRVIDTVATSLPSQNFETEAVWFAPKRSVLDDIGAEDELGSLHAAEHGMIALLPLLALCDRNDIGGLSTDWHVDTGAASIFIYDGYDGGVGINRVGFDEFERWVEATRDAIAACPCASGCPSCVQSPKCGNLNEPLHKAGALAVLESLLG